MQSALHAFCVSTTASSTEDAALLLADPWTRRLGSWWFRIHARKIKYRKGTIHGMEEFRSPGQPYPYSWSIFQQPIKFWYWMCGWRWKNLESCVFLCGGVPAWFCHSQLLAKNYYLRLASLFWTAAWIQLACVFSLASTSSNDIFWNRCHSSTRELIHFVVWLLIGRPISWLICHRGAQLLSPGVPVSLAWDCLRNSAVTKEKQRPNPWDSKAEDVVARFCSLLGGSDGWVCLLGPSTILELACGLWVCSTKRSSAGPVWRFLPLSTACLGIVGVGLRGWLCRRARLKTWGRLVWTSSWQRPWGEPLVNPLRKLCFRGLKMLSAEPIFLGWAGHTCKIWRGRVRLTASELSLSL